MSRVLTGMETLDFGAGAPHTLTGHVGYLGPACQVVQLHKELALRLALIAKEAGRLAHSPVFPVLLPVQRVSPPWCISHILSDLV